MSSLRSTPMKIYDVSVLIHPQMPIYPGDAAVSTSQINSTSAGDRVNLSSICLGVHAGTHIDAPYHVDGSWPKLQDIDLATMVGPVTVFELDVAERIGVEDLAGLQWSGVERVLFKTRNSQLWNGGFRTDFVYLADDGAQFLAQNAQVRLVGIDYLSVEKFGAETFGAHRELLSRGIVVVEGLNLSQVPPGDYELICLPLRLANQDGAPVRAILIGR